MRNRPSLSPVEELLLARKNPAFAKSLDRFCPICETIKPLIEDRHYFTKKVRGKVCQNCYAGLCEFKDNLSLYEHALTICKANPTNVPTYSRGCFGLKYLNSTKLIERAMKYVRQFDNLTKL